jgi:hypothetical protein
MAEPVHLNAKQQKAVSLQQKSDQIVKELARYSVQVGNEMVTRHEQFVGYLVTIGVITSDQLDDFNIKWEESRLAQLTEARKKVLQAIRQQRLTEGLNNTGGPMLPTSPGGIILPRG